MEGEIERLGDKKCRTGQLEHAPSDLINKISFWRVRHSRCLFIAYLCLPRDGAINQKLSH